MAPSYADVPARPHAQSGLITSRAFFATGGCGHPADSAGTAGTHLGNRRDSSSSRRSQCVTADS